MNLETYNEVVAEARAEDECDESEEAQLIAAMRAAVADVPSYCERYQDEALEEAMRRYEEAQACGESEAMWLIR